VISVAAFERHDLEEFVRAWDAAFRRSEHEAIAAIYDDTAVLVASDTSACIGRDAITEFWRKACASAQRRGIRRIVHTDQYDSCGGLAYLQGTVSLKSDLGETTVVWFVTLWRRYAEGTWRIVADTSTVASPRMSGGAAEEWELFH
jgi:ketosteroid isomerase-like protein